MNDWLNQVLSANSRVGGYPNYVSTGTFHRCRRRSIYFLLAQWRSQDVWLECPMILCRLSCPRVNSNFYCSIKIFFLQFAANDVVEIIQTYSTA